MASFLIRVLSLWAAMHRYVFWRLASIPWLSHHFSTLTLAITGTVLWASYLVARILDAKGLQAISWPVEYVAANWIGILFLLFWAFFTVDVLTLAGWLF